MKIERIDCYDDPRFHQQILYQHGAFVIDDIYLCEVEIINQNSAIIHYHDRRAYEKIIQEFRFYALHITHFYDEQHQLIKSFSDCQLFWLDIQDIQPSQFYVSQKKAQAVSSFIKQPQDVIIPLFLKNKRYIALDGHTRLYIAYQKGFHKVLGYLTETSDYIFDFVQEAHKRGINHIDDCICLSHDNYQRKWFTFCDQYFADKE